MSAIFLSHSSQDNHIAAAIQKKLAADGHRSIFLDFDPSDGIPAGRDWEQELYRQLRACQAVIVLCSEHSMKSQWCFAEITHAKALGKPIFPAKIGHCTINTVLTSRQMLDFTTQATEAYERLRRGLKAAGLDPAGAFDWDGSRPPYPGLLAFDEPDAAIFFGRDTETQQALELLNRRRQFGGPRMLVVLGASGSGKSSLVRAGMIPRLRNNADDWLVVDPFRPREDPFQELAMAISCAFERYGTNRSPGQLRDALEAGGSGYAGGAVLYKLAAELQVAAGRRDTVVLLTIDQMEELLGPRGEARRGFLGMIQCALTERGTPLMVVGTLRSDFLGELQAEPAMRQLRFDTLPVGPMAADSLVQVIEGPAQKAAVDLERGLTQTLIKDTEAENALPLLAFTLRELYEQYGGDGRLTVDEYARQLGGLTGSVARSAEAVFEAEPLTDAQLSDLRLAFLSMVRVNQEGQFARQPAKFSDIPESVRPVIERFVKARLLVARGELEERIVEVAHEAIFRAWDRLKGWLAEDREFLLWRKRLHGAVAEWQRVGKDRSALLKGPALAEARGWLERQVSRLAPDEREFLTHSVQAGDRERRRRGMIAGGTIAASLLVAAVGVYLWQRAETLRQAAEVERKRAQDAQAEEVKARNAMLETNVNLAWAGLTKPACPPEESKSYLEGGLRALHCAVSPYMDLSRVALLAGTRIFVSGPHTTEKLNLKSEREFGHYNLAFVAWAIEHLIPPPTDRTRETYDRFAKRRARTYLLAYQYWLKYPELLEKEAKEYRDREKGLRENPLEISAREPGFWQTFLEKIENDPDIKHLSGEGGQIVLYDADTAMKFWARRTVDGTAPEFYRGLVKLLSTFDPDFARRRAG